ncbi:MAG: hypothetical protein EAZ90_13575 [Oscillatoriales cyanobacterium]|nr:MAG: hypothetical protein EAZ94_03195 [Oscillatoriales cyanobacterium]TAE26046.1 MAG: hypothetical protein EAZ93_08800 [Oscillatoriales cyanobacterium]TAE42891.1 MAG: hypothetical protein EAZ90_13575 [Oscillatoriales cyanobacterium]TAE51785.1 MAG: hypothetical protein EAZ88_17300 [Oscillatoriales cyanobacterium]TAE70402.1 MAG: hypothetical protein EAZ86_06515 [Oscillatoriales cyanobacterium]
MGNGESGIGNWELVIGNWEWVMGNGKFNPITYKLSQNSKIYRRPGEGHSRLHKQNPPPRVEVLSFSVFLLPSSVFLLPSSFFLHP